MMNLKIMEVNDIKNNWELFLGIGLILFGVFWILYTYKKPLGISLLDKTSDYKDIYRGILAIISGSYLVVPFFC